MNNTITIKEITIEVDRVELLEKCSNEDLTTELESRGFSVEKDPREPYLSDFSEQEIEEYALDHLKVVSKKDYLKLASELELLQEKYEPRNIIEADCITEFYRILRKGEISIYDVKQIGIKLLID